MFCKTPLMDLSEFCTCHNYTETQYCNRMMYNRLLTECVDLLDIIDHSYVTIIELSDMSFVFKYNKTYSDGTPITLDAIQFTRYDIRGNTDAYRPGNFALLYTDKSCEEIFGSVFLKVYELVFGKALMGDKN